MQPSSAAGPRSDAPRPGFSSGPGLIVGILALLALVYLLDHASKGEAALFSGVDRRISEQDFRRGECTAVFGGCNIDLRDAQIQGREAVLETYAVFGGVEIRVPENWEVVNRGVGIFGGFDNRTLRPRGGAGTKTLVLRGVALFGGVTVKD